MVVAARDMDRIQWRLLCALSHSPLSYWGLLRAARAQTREAIQAMTRLLEHGYIAARDDGFVLTDTGQKAMRTMAARPVGVSTVDPALDIARAALPGLLEAFEQLAGHRPGPSAQYDQGHVTPETVIKRLWLMASRGDLAGRRVLLLGDDDLTSLAAALSGLPARIVVLDVDPRIVRFVQSVAEKQRWRHVEARVYDVREELPGDLRGSFDTFFTDPIDTVPGLLLFLSRCTEALRGVGGAGYFGLSYLEASGVKWRRVQRAVIGMGYTITDVLPGFQSYRLDPAVAREWADLSPVPVVSPPDTVFYTSALHRVELVGAPQPVYTGRADFGSEMYADEEFTQPEP